jgi:predicted adenine nucleotide alpha hydrolase (AANH) superfamily ATPase
MSDMRLVLLSCCAPCSAGAIKQLADGAVPGISDFIVLFYNPNIFPESEYTKRMQEQIKYCETLGVKYAVLEYDHDAWRDAVRGFEAAPERGARCSLCFEYRFRRAEKFARENGYNAIASVLGVSRHKDQHQVDRAATSACPDFQYIPIRWDENLRVQINRSSDFYRQNYCGCEFSIRKV